MANRKIKIQDFLSNVPLFSELEPAELDAIALGTTEMKVRRGEIVFQRGEPCLGLHVLIYGQIKLSVVSSPGNEKVVKIIRAGDSFGEALMFMGKNYIVTAQALEDCLVLHVSRNVINAELAKSQNLTFNMLKGLSQRLYGLMEDVESYSLRSGAQRVIGYLLKHDHCENGETITLSTSKAIIASRLNITPEHFSRILLDLSTHGLIKVKGKEITILDMQGLIDF